jgi:ketosteroid isomerase-like protein
MSVLAAKQISKSADEFSELRMRTILIMMITALLCSMHVRAQSTFDTEGRESIRALENAWDQAQERGDATALAPILDNSLIYVDYDGKLLTKAEYLARVKANNIHMDQIVTEQMNVQMYGNTAIVVGTYRVKGVERGKPYLRRGRFTDTWTLIKKNWICIAASTTPIIP